MTRETPRRQAATRPPGLAHTAHRERAMRDSRTIAQHSGGGDEGISETPQRAAGFPTYEEYIGV